MLKKLIPLFLLLAPAVFGQTTTKVASIHVTTEIDTPVVEWTTTTVSGLGAGASGYLKVVSDGSTATDCTVGSGSNTVFCYYTGSAWASLLSSGGGTPGGSNGQVQYKNGASFSGTAGITTDGNSVRITGPVPFRDASAFGAVSSSSTFTATCNGTSTVTINSAGDWVNGQYISIAGCGAVATVLPPDFTPIAITSVTRAGSTSTATIAGIGNLLCNNCVQWLNVTGVTDTSFNGIYESTGGGDSTHIPYFSNSGSATTSSGGFINPGIAIYEGTNPGSTTYTYNVCTMDFFGGCSAKSLTLTVTNGPATLTNLDHIWLYFGWNFPTGGDGYCIYQNGSFIARSWNPAYEDDGTVWARNYNCPSTAPTSATNQTLTTTIASGAGTTTLVLANAATATASGKFTFHDSTPAINAAIAAAKTDASAANGNGAEVILPYGNYWIQRLQVDAYRLQVSGSLNLTEHPVIVTRGSTVEGYGTIQNTPTRFGADRLRLVTGNMDGFLLLGASSAQSTIRNFYTLAGLTHDVVLAGDTGAGPDGITIQNFDAVHTTAGDCLLDEGDTIFLWVDNVSCATATTSQGAATNRFAFYLSNRFKSGGGDWDETHWRKISLNGGGWYLDSPAPLGAALNEAQLKLSDFTDVDWESFYSKGLFTVDAGCQNSPLAMKADAGALIFDQLIGSDPNATMTGLFYFPRDGTTGCTGLNVTASDNVYIGERGVPEVGGNTALAQGLSVGTSNSVSLDPSNSPTDANLTSGESRVGGGSVVAGVPLLCNRDGSNGGDVAACGYLIPPPQFIFNDGGGSTSCTSPVTVYFRMSVSDGSGNFSKAYPEKVITTGAGQPVANGDIIQLLYGPTLNEGIIGAKYRVYVGSSSGGENIYYETTNTSTFNYDCVTGSNGNHSASVGGAPPSNGTAYYWKVPSRSGDPGWNGLASTDLMGFGKTNPAYSVDSSGTVNADAALRLNAKLVASATAPTISAHFNTSGDSVSLNNGTASFTVTVGSGTAGSTGAVGLPTALNDWNCQASDKDRAAWIQQTGWATTSATFTNYGATPGTPVNWTNGDHIKIVCIPE